MICSKQHNNHENSISDIFLLNITCKVSVDAFCLLFLPFRYARVLQPDTRHFSCKQLCPQDSSGLISTSFPNVFKFLCVSGHLSLEVTNMPETAKFLGSYLTSTCFFFIILFQIKFSANYLCANLLSN